jgi:hypothetical protein
MTKTKTQKQRAKAQRRSVRKAPRQAAVRTARRQPKRNVVGKMRNPVLGMSQCAKEYLNVLNNPFSGNVACVPCEFNFPSLKQSFRAAGTFTTGLAGVGFVSMNPFVMVLQGALGVAPNPIAYSLSNFTSLAFQPIGTTGVAAAVSTCPYPSSLTFEQCVFRLVAAGLRVRNVTPLLSRGGSLIGIETMNHDPLTGLTIDGALLEDSSERCNTNSTNWNSVVFHPQQPSEISFNGPSVSVNFMGFIAQSTANDGTVAQIYEWEAIVAVETKGSFIHGLTPSYSDPVGFGMVQNMTASVNDRKPFLSDDAGIRLSRLGEIAGYAAGFAGSAYRAYKGVSRPTILGGPRIELVD